MRLRPIDEVVAEVAALPDKGVVFWDDNIGGMSCLWWNVPKNVGYMLGFTGEVRARAAMHRPDES